jgi:hypothetical protein
VTHNFFPGRRKNENSKISRSALSRQVLSGLQSYNGQKLNLLRAPSGSYDERTSWSFGDNIDSVAFCLGAAILIVLLPDPSGTTPFTSTPVT